MYKKMISLFLSVFILTVLPRFVDVRQGEDSTTWGAVQIVCGILFFSLGCWQIRKDEKKSEEQSRFNDELKATLTDINEAIEKDGGRYDQQTKSISKVQVKDRAFVGLYVGNSPGSNISNNEANQYNVDSPPPQ